MNYILKKLSIDDPDAGTAVSEGHVTHGMFFDLFNFSTGEIIKGSKLNQIEPGWQLLMLTKGFGYHKTSKIKEIVLRNGNVVVFKTQTSTYRIEELED